MLKNNTSVGLEFGGRVKSLKNSLERLKTEHLNGGIIGIPKSIRCKHTEPWILQQILKFSKHENTLKTFKRSHFQQFIVSYTEGRTFAVILVGDRKKSNTLSKYSASKESIPSFHNCLKFSEK
uniref:Uncharacterized protein n=1 Tax=Pipistrellus kuhlii TaxID=59472 RepID=A0A7J7YX42_PIPKU|nr:hypothetical protein mPipKuh1_009827 [Pipistrellus kuhlii]